MFVINVSSSPPQRFLLHEIMSDVLRKRSPALFSVLYTGVATKNPLRRTSDVAFVTRKKYFRRPLGTDAFLDAKFGWGVGRPAPRDKTR